MQQRYFIRFSYDGTNYHGVIYRVGQFVTVGVNSSAQGTILSSSDGISWTTRTPGVASTLRGVAYGANRFVVVGDNGTVLTSAPVGSAPVVATDPASQTIYAGLSNGGVSKSTNGGGSWTVLVATLN